eukprot:Clim_evm21s6 gene=Clim_evmTU21s6
MVSDYQRIFHSPDEEHIKIPNKNAEGPLGPSVADHSFVNVVGRDEDIGDAHHSIGINLGRYRNGPSMEKTSMYGANFVTSDEAIGRTGPALPSGVNQVSTVSKARRCRNYRQGHELVDNKEHITVATSRAAGLCSPMNTIHKP